MPSADPSSIVATPWNSVVLDLSSTGAALATVEDLVGALRVQLLLNASQDIDLRIQAARVWVKQRINPASDADIAPLIAEFYDLDSYLVATPISIQRDEPGRNTYARAAFSWPRDQQNNTFNSGNTNSMLQTVVGVAVVAEARTQIYVQVLWRPALTSTRLFERTNFKPTLQPFGLAVPAESMEEGSEPS